MSVTGNKLYILRALERGCAMLNLFARSVQDYDNGNLEYREQRYNKQLHRINGMREMAECFGYEVTFDFDEKQGFFAEVTHINILYVDDDGTVLSEYRHDMRRERK